MPEVSFPIPGIYIATKAGFPLATFFVRSDFCRSNPTLFFRNKSLRTKKVASGKPA